MSKLKGKVIAITGASRGIGHAIGMRAARDGASLAILAKTDQPHPSLPGTIHTAREDMENAGGRAIAIVCDVRHEEKVASAFATIKEQFGRLDVLVNNASAINLSGTESLSMKRFDLMHQVNARGTFLCSKLAIDLLKDADNPHILNLSPPLNLSSRWFEPHVGYTMSKYGMSMCTLGMAGELRELGIAVNSLWPETGIATAAVKNLLGGEEAIKKCRKPDIVADAAHWILTQDASKCSGNFFIDSEVLEQAGIKDLSSYAVDPSTSLMPDFFLDLPAEQAAR